MFHQSPKDMLGDHVAAVGPSSQSDQPAIAWILQVLRRNLRLIIAAVVVAVLGAGSFAALVKPQYTAVVELLINPSDLRVVDNGAVTRSQAADSDVTQIESQVRVLTSDNVLRPVIAAEGLDHDVEFIGDEPSLPSRMLATLAAWLPGQVSAAPVAPAEAALIELRRRVGVRRPERTFVIDVSVHTRNAEKSARIANAIASAYKNERIAANSEANRQVSESLTGRLDELKERVRRSEQELQDYKTSHNILDAAGQLINERQLSEVSSQLIAARARANEMQSRYDQLESVAENGPDAGSIPEAIQSPTISALRIQYAELMRQEEQQAQTLGQRHPALAVTEAQLVDLRGMIRDELRRILGSVREEYDRAKANQAALTDNLEQLKQEAIKINEAMLSTRELERTVQVNRGVYEAFLARARETGEQEQLDPKNIRVISEATPPPRRSFPPGNTTLGLAALALGLMAGIGLAFLREMARTPAPAGRAAPPGLAGGSGEVREAAARPILVGPPLVFEPARPHAAREESARPSVAASET